ncbi:hypothetical protein BIW11_09521 [Tropilaelaps mercedesae]|uniref:Uncharacterized protein n=1 Tax=Tropilaelaps mercedesae TaxID=418985 RepID=A0A1V9XJR8_9ACAR|nr:hypothetical protein BIW11_09521 [Tropilaelaps mercedesae]
MNAFVVIAFAVLSASAAEFPLSADNSFGLKTCLREPFKDLRQNLQTEMVGAAVGALEELNSEDFVDKVEEFVNEAMSLLNTTISKTAAAFNDCRSGNVPPLCFMKVGAGMTYSMTKTVGQIALNIPKYFSPKDARTAAQYAMKFTPLAIDGVARASTTFIETARLCF